MSARRPRRSPSPCPRPAPCSQTVALGSADDSILVVGQLANQASALSRKRAAERVRRADPRRDRPVSRPERGGIAAPPARHQRPERSGRRPLRRRCAGSIPTSTPPRSTACACPRPKATCVRWRWTSFRSDIIESIEVKKSLTPDMDADTIGASIEIKTTSAFDRKKDLFTARIEGSYNDYADELTPKGSFDFATRVTDNFGIVRRHVLLPAASSRPTTSRRTAGTTTAARSMPRKSNTATMMWSASGSSRRWAPISRVGETHRALSQGRVEPVR